MTALTVTRIDPPTITAWKITAANALDVETALATIAQIGWKGDIADYIQPNSGGTLVWAVTLSRSGFTTLVAYDGNWIVYDGTTVSILTDAEFLANYTTNVPLVWEATTTAPTAAAVSGAQATITFPQPTSPNGPWSYTVAQTDTTANTTSGATLSGAPVIANGNVTLTVNGLTVGDSYTFTVTVAATNYHGSTATSIATATITATK